MLSPNSRHNKPKAAWGTPFSRTSAPSCANGHAPHALDFIQIYEGKSYKEAVCILAGTIDLPAPAGPVQNMKLPPPEEKQEFILPERAGNFRNLFAYLEKERGIDPALVKHLVERRQIYQGITYNKLKIIGYTGDGTAQYNVKKNFMRILHCCPEFWNPSIPARTERRTTKKNA